MTVTSSDAVFLVLIDGDIEHEDDSIAQGFVTADKNLRIS
jgi:hypothetical protein